MCWDRFAETLLDSITFSPELVRETDHGASKGVNFSEYSCVRLFQFEDDSVRQLLIAEEVSNIFGQQLRYFYCCKMTTRIMHDSSFDVTQSLGPIKGLRILVYLSTAQE